MHSIAEEISLLQKYDKGIKLPYWILSPKAVFDFIVGTTLPDGSVILPKYIGQHDKIQLAIASLMTGRPLLLTGLPGTGKSLLSRLLAIAINGQAKHTVYGSAGVSENAIKYNWNYALLIANGTNREALIPSPVLAGMEAGELVRIEEFSRLTTEVQDAFIGILSEKEMAIPELNTVIVAKDGFNIIATSNTQDSGLFEMSAAIQRRFNIVELSPPESEEEENDIVLQQLLQNNVLQIDQTVLAQYVHQLVSFYRYMRAAKLAENNQLSGYQYSSADAIAMVATLLSGQFIFPEKKIIDTMKKEIATLLKKESESIRIKAERWEWD